MIITFKRIYLLTIFFVFLFPSIGLAASFGIKPAYPRQENPRTESIFVQTINPGEIKEEGVKVINSTNLPKNLILYARDSLRSSGGGFACTQISEKPINAGKWINFNIENLEEDVESVKNGNLPGTIEITIPAGTEIIIPFTINVPKDASVGEHNGCVLIQELKEKTSTDVGVSLSLRSGLRVAINVPGEVVRKLEFESFDIEKKNKSIYLKPSVKNTGNVSIDTNVEVNVRYFFGLLHRKFGGEFPVLRNEVYDFNFELKKPFWGGLYLVNANFSYDEGKDAGIGVKSGNKFTSIKSNTAWFVSAPTTLGLVIEIFILFVLLCIFALRRLHKKKQKWIKKWTEYEVKSGDNLGSLSKEYRVHWEIIAEVNKIKPPYNIKEGEIIKLPPKKIKSN